MPPTRPTPASLTATVTALLSVQPKSDEYQPPYLDNSLGGTVPGAALAIQ